MEAKIVEICEIEVGLYLGYYNGEYKFREFNQKQEKQLKQSMLIKNLNIII